MEKWCGRFRPRPTLQEWARGLWRYRRKLRARNCGRRTAHRFIRRLRRCASEAKSWIRWKPLLACGQFGLMRKPVFPERRADEGKGRCAYHDAERSAPRCGCGSERRLRLAKEIGVSSVFRTSQSDGAGFTDPGRIGLMVMDEAFDEQTGAKNKWNAGRNNGKAYVGIQEFFDAMGSRCWRNGRAIAIILRSSL